MFLSGAFRVRVQMYTFTGRAMRKHMNEYEYEMKRINLMDGRCLTDLISLSTRRLPTCLLACLRTYLLTCIGNNLLMLVNMMVRVKGEVEGEGE